MTGAAHSGQAGTWQQTGSARGHTCRAEPSTQGLLQALPSPVAEAERCPVLAGPRASSCGQKKGQSPVTLPVGTDNCPLCLSPGLLSTAWSHRASGTYKCPGIRGSGQLWASPKPRRGCPFASADAVICYPLHGQHCFFSWHMDCTDAMYLVIWETSGEGIPACPQMAGQ